MSSPRSRRRPSTLPWTWRVRHAFGYRELGLLKEAQKELRAIKKADAGRAEVLGEWTSLHQVRGDWAAMATTAAVWVERARDDAGAWVAWAYGTRRADSLVAAEKILLQALLHHPHQATIHFNLGCYACQNGDLTQAQRRVVKAIALDASFKALAKIDPDLAPLRESGGLPA